MSRRGCPYDNAIMENFFGTFKTECLYRCKPTTGEQVQQLVDEYIHFYNYQRIDMKNGLTPFEIGVKPRNVVQFYDGGCFSCLLAL